MITLNDVKGGEKRSTRIMTVMGGRGDTRAREREIEREKERGRGGGVEEVDVMPALSFFAARKLSHILPSSII